MSFRTVASCLSFALLLTACFPVPSVHPLCSEEEAVFDPALVGVWTGEEDSQLTISRQGEKGYLLTLIAEEEKLQLQGRLMRLGDTSFMDLGPLSEDDDSEGERLVYQHLLTVHTIYRVEIEADTLKLFFLDHDWVEKKVKSGELSIQHTLVDDVIVLTAASSDLQTLVRRYAQDPDAFSNLGLFKK